RVTGARLDGEERRARKPAALFAHGIGARCNRSSRPDREAAPARASGKRPIGNSPTPLGVWPSVQILPFLCVHFPLALPCERSTTGPMAENNGALAEANEGTRAAGGKRVLVVDDDPETVAGLADILREDGLQVDVVGSAEDALERFKATTYHLLLTDLLLPGKSGVELTKMIHDAAPATAIVLITGHATVK